MKKRLVICVGILALLTVILAGCGGMTMSSSWSHTGLSHTEEENSWEITASKVNGHTSRSQEFSADNLAALHVQNTNGAGNVSVLLTQGDTEKTVDVTGEFNESIDMAGFEAGSLTLRLNFENAEDVSIMITW